ncbi:hypothetical protein L596_027379 [Steinernema carpocapsae]|uniref:Uncharacterized protein n=1 Tax=Steinernema carpocapsae TaxID=34508 RepID=A0A4U5M453_STECR|nr:hypothetical protein L596_027379 [Steinernema carpocapsae]
MPPKNSKEGCNKHNHNYGPILCHLVCDPISSRHFGSFVTGTIWNTVPIRSAQVPVAVGYSANYDLYLWRSSEYRSALLEQFP